MDGKSQKEVCQNRLLIASMVVLFYYYSDATIDGVSVVGAKIDFKNKDAFIEFAWVVWLYYYVRVYQYFKEEGIKIFENSINKVYVNEIGHIIMNIDKDDLKLLSPEHAIKNGVIKIKFKTSFINFAKKVSRFNRGKTLVINARLSYYILDHLKIDRLSEFSSEHVKAKYITINFLKGKNKPLSIIKRMKGYFINKALMTIGFILFPYTLVAEITPPTDRNFLAGESKYDYILPRSYAFKVPFIVLKSLIKSPYFFENYGALIIGLLPIWYYIYKYAPWIFVW